MGIFGDSGLLGKMFDLNRDGKVDGFEQTMEFALLAGLMDEEKEVSLDNDDFDNDDDLDDDLEEDW